MKKLQIGVIGSMGDLEMEITTKEEAKRLGKEIAKNTAILVFGYEDDFESYSSIAATAAENEGGHTLAFLRGSNKSDSLNLNSMRVFTGQDRGGGREFSFVLSCDAIISINGGSGTLMEIAMAYQAQIPVVSLENSSGWSQKLSGKYLDGRKKIKIIGAKTPEEAVKIAIKLANKSE